MKADTLQDVIPEDVGLSSDRLDRLDRALEEQIRLGRLPGAVYMVSRFGRVVRSVALGRQRPDADTPMGLDSIFRVYSMTKPIVSVAAMMLVEEGRLSLADPLSKFVPAYGEAKVLEEATGALSELARPITVQDLLRHTSGIGYEFLGSPAFQRRYIEAKVYRRNWTSAEHAETLARLPLGHHPGGHWDYSRSTDVLGHVVELVAGQGLGDVLRERILDPLGMVDTGFYVPDADLDRVADPLPVDPDTGDAVRLLNAAERPMFESGGGGLFSTVGDYGRFLGMLAGQGELDGVRLLGRKTIELMTSDHLGPEVEITSDLLPPGYGFGLGFAVRLESGMAPVPASPGTYYWGGIAGTTFWVDPEEELTAVLMIQAPGQRDYYRALFRTMVYAALVD